MESRSRQLTQASRILWSDEEWLDEFAITFEFNDDMIKQHFAFMASWKLELMN
jgi:hypothetical protein